MIWWMSIMTMEATIQPFLGSTPYTLSAGQTHHQHILHDMYHCMLWRQSRKSQTCRQYFNTQGGASKGGLLWQFAHPVSGYP